MPYTTEGQNVFGQPGHLAVGLAGGAANSFVDVGLVPRVDILPKFYVQSITNEVGQSIGTPIRTLMGYTVTVTMLEFDADQIVALLPGLALKGTSGGVGFQAGQTEMLTRISMHVRTVAAINADPLQVTDTRGWWFPSLEMSGFSELIFKTEEGESVEEPFTITYEAYRVVEDYASTAQAIDSEGQTGFQGASTDHVANYWEPALPARFLPPVYYIAVSPDQTFSDAEYVAGTTSVLNSFAAPTFSALSYLSIAVPAYQGDITDILVGTATGFGGFARVAGTRTLPNGVLYKVWDSTATFNVNRSGALITITQ